jgi:hypothetical protein
MTNSERGSGRPVRGAPGATTRRGGIRAATVVWLATLAGNVGLMALWLPYATVGGGVTLSIALLPPVMAVYASLGWLIVRHQPGHRVGWLLLAAAPFAIVFAGGIGLGAPLASARGPYDPLAGALITLAIASLVPLFVMVFGMLPILYPDGHLPGPRWRWPVRAVVAGTVTSAVCFLLAPTADPEASANNPFAPPGAPAQLSDAAGVAGTATVVVVGALAITSVVVRFQRGHGDERQQMKWMLAPVVILVGINLPTFLGANLPDIVLVVQTVCMLLVPVAITAAILRYRLYDIDRLISRTIAYAVVSAILVALFLLGNLVLQAALEGITQGDTLAVAASTLLAFAAAQPLWRRVRRIVDQRFDRARSDGALTLAAFSDRQRDRVDLQAVLDDVCRTADGSLWPTSIGLWLRGDARSTPEGPSAS